MNTSRRPLGDSLRSAQLVFWHSMLLDITDSNWCLGRWLTHVSSAPQRCHPSPRNILREKMNLP